MLTQLTVSNFAIAEYLELHFENGMTALTGETGAGKSIALDALSLTLGARADAAMVREGADRADITATLDIRHSGAARAWLVEHDLDDGDDCILRRVVRRDGRSRGYINGQPCPLQDLRELGGLLIEIHGQHQHQSLLKPDFHRRLLDDFAGATELAEETASLFRQWKETRHRLEEQKNDREAREARVELLRYQVEELARLALEADELPALEQEQESLANGETILQQVHGAAELSGEGDTSAADLAGRALALLEQLPVAVPTLDETRGMLEEARIQLQEASNNLRHFIDDYELDPVRLQEVEERLSAAYQLARKHRVQPAELPALHQRLADELAGLEDGEQSLSQLGSEVARLEQAYRERAEELSTVRRHAAERLDAAVAEQLAELGMGQTRFVTRLTPVAGDAPRAHGNETIEFLVSTNTGQPARPLARIASGGELSRLSLAIQVVLAQTSTIPVLVFDEVDVGIGGGTAEVVGRLLRRLGSSGQTLCVTHLPQVAAQAHQHLFVSKSSDGKATFSEIRKLEADHRVKEVARMLGGVELTDQTLAHAREMVEKGQAMMH